MKELNEIFDYIDDLESSDCDCFYSVADVRKNLYKIEDYIQELEWELKIKSYSAIDKT